ncbi:long-chain fatty acid--CoA ligase [uncultured Jatrophihabitans sp.]|uniref:long-chain fatty acid--CoA ligase n=1 Tax=uncultured Jatrophihabitans sp. TaxID=1610747 RepID=UPI0035CA2EF5
MNSTMQDDFQLTVTAVLEHGTTVFGRSECRTWQGDGTSRNATFAEVGANAKRLANALTGLGVERGDRVGTLCWNSQEHLETYFAVPCMGAVLHTLNLRLPPGQLAHIVNHAEDKVVVVDASLLPLLAAIASQLKTVEHFVVIGDGDTSVLGDDVPVHAYADLLADADAEFDWPELDEKTPASMCYTSGTTGDPKGVVYSHRSIYLHALATLSNTGTGSTEADRALVVVPMFHVNAWGIPFGSFLSGATMLMPGSHMTPDALCDIVQTERATFVSAVPTLWGGMLQVAQQRDVDFSSVRMGTSGGAAIPRSLMEAFEERGVRIIQGWGMTETSPVGGMAHPPADVEPGSADELDWRLKSGRLIAGVQMRIVSDDGDVLPWDGEAVGEMEVRGPWITAGYHLDDAAEKFDDGWLRTGDIGTIDDRGFFQITDRSKDVIKSGGEWISSVELENLLAASPDVAEAAVIGIPDEKWTERPLACIVAKGDAVDPQQLATFLDGKVASWQVPENWVFVDEVPKTSVGKFDKKVLRARYADGDFEVSHTKAPGRK